MGKYFNVWLSLLLVFSTIAMGQPAQADNHFELMISASPDRAAAVPLAGQGVTGDIYVFVAPEEGVRRVRFWVDDPARSGPADQTENRAPYDLAGTNSDDTAKPFDTSGLTGSHEVTAQVETTTGASVVISSTFTVSTADALVFDQSSVVLSLDPDSTDSATANLTTNTGASANFNVSENASWLTVSPSSGSTPSTVTLSADSTGLSPGSYTTTLTATALGFESTTLSVALNVADSYSLQLSYSPDRAGSVPLDGQSVTGDIYVFVAPEEGVRRVRFWVDDPARSGPADQTENRAPYDLAGTNSDDTAKPFDTSTLTDGAHDVTASITLSDGTEQVVNAGFTVGSGTTPGLEFDVTSTSFILDPDTTDSATVSLATNTGDPAAFTVTDDASWLNVTPASGTTPSILTLDVDATGLVTGTYSASVSATASGFASATTSVTLSVNGTFDLLLSTSPDRSGATPLAGQTVAGDIYVFLAPEAGVEAVEFFIDDPGQSGPPVRFEGNAPFDLGGTASNGDALPYDVSTLTDGSHTLTAVLTMVDSSSLVVESTFSVTSGLVPALEFDPASVSVSLDPDTSTTSSVVLSTNTGDAASFTVADDVPWLTVTPGTGSTPGTLTLGFDATGLVDGSYNAQVTATATDFLAKTVPVTMVVGQPECLPLTCGEILIDLPYALEFDFDPGKILDGAGVGTGFTYIDQPSNGTGYIPTNLAVDLVAGTLSIQTTDGLASGSANSLDNALGVGIDAASQVSLLNTSIIDPPAGSGNFEQAGLWFGNDEDNYVKMVIQSTSSGPRVEFLTEVGGVHVDKFQRLIGDPTGRSVNLQLRVDPSTQQITGYYSFDTGPLGAIGTATLPPEFFSFDAAGIDPRIGTRSFGGVFASHRRAPQSLEYVFDYFSVSEEQDIGTGAPLDFQRVSYGVPTPTSMAWGPDDRLYVTELFGRIHALTFDANWQVVDDEVIDTLTDAWGGSRMTLGIEVDPDSTPSNVILWVGHSDGSVNNGKANSGAVSRLSGPGFAVVDNVITGLPRAIANHGLNSIHFGPDGRLYLAMGGNTGGGAPNDEATEFGPRPEQPLSAALVVADVKATGFQGECASWVDDSTGTADKVIPATCDVLPFSTGLRNMYDFVFHSNGEIYGPDNGLGVKGTVPQSPTPDCQGIVTYGSGSLDPGQQGDPLIRLVEGAYYGHPNPARDECVFKDGSFQGVAPLPNYTPAMENLGLHKSANGIIEYRSDLRCGALQGNLLIANYSTGDDITRVVLSEDRTSVVGTASLIGGFDDPLPLEQSPNGTIFVGELGAGLVTAVVPTDIGCWLTEPSAPVDMLDVAGAAINGIIYVVAGKTPAGPQTTVRTFVPATGVWGTVADLPGPGVENPAVVASGDLLYAFGGSTSPFSGAVTNAAVFDPATGAWTPLASMPTARAGATAQILGGLIYIVGGMGSDGGSLDVVEIYDPATDAWTAGPSMAVRRDNPGSAALDGKLYVFGGRTRDASGTEIDGTLSSVEMFDPATGTWSARAPMPTGRRTFSTVVLNGRALVMGGERTVNGGAFSQNEEYNPVTDTWRGLEPMLSPRHGAAAAVVDGRAYVIGGGVVAGGSYSSINESFAFVGQ